MSLRFWRRPHPPLLWQRVRRPAWLRLLGIGLGPLLARHHGAAGLQEVRDLAVEIYAAR
jgi:hypothetical protein